jgi:uncharacterized membrane protein YphA (DoxX/SURF4 family)
MNNFLSNKYLLLILRLVLGGLFIFSAVTKIIDAEYFAKSLYNYRLLPEASLNFVALIIPWIELMVGVLLALGIFVRESALLGTVMMVVFIAAISMALARGLDIECGCFGTKDGGRVGILKIIEDVLLLLGFIWLTLYGSDFISLLKPGKINIKKNTGP